MDAPDAPERRARAAWPRRVASTYGGVAIDLLSLADLLTNKRAVGRPQDMIDVEHLERPRRDRESRDRQ